MARMRESEAMARVRRAANARLLDSVSSFPRVASSLSIPRSILNPSGPSRQASALPAARRIGVPGQRGEREPAELAALCDTRASAPTRATNP